MKITLFCEFHCWLAIFNKSRWRSSRVKSSWIWGSSPNRKIANHLQFSTKKLWRFRDIKVKWIIGFWANQVQELTLYTNVLQLGLLLTSLAPGHSLSCSNQVQHRVQLSESPGAWSLLLIEMPPPRKLYV